MPITVLVAEDEFLIAAAVIDELEAAGFVAIGPFARVAQALDYCRTHTPDCAVLDVRLADGESFGVADVLAERHVPLVFHSAHASGEALTSRYAGARVCPKPSAFAGLADAVSALCREGYVSA